MFNILSALIVLGGVSDYRKNFPLPDLTVSSGWGVNIHFTDEQPGELAQISKAGFKWVRMDLIWSGIEREKGKYDFSAYDRLMAGLKKNHIRPLFILDYGNDLYESGSPHTEVTRDAFCHYVEAAVKRYRGQGVIWEMWNEPNISFWQPKPNVYEYIALALAVGKTIQKISPEEWTIGPATSTFDWNYLESCFKGGLLSYWDAVSVHPYRQESPETVLLDWDRLNKLVASYAPNLNGKAKKIPLFSGEWGYSTAWGNQSPEKQADYVVRQYLTNLSAGVPLSIYYDWKEDGTEPKEAEHHFGLVTPELAPKPAFLRVASLTATLQGYRFVRRLPASMPGDELLLFSKGRNVALVAWTTGDAHDMALEGLQKGSQAAPRIVVTQSPQVVFLPRGFRIPLLAK